jgi:hypothetical protein
VQGNAVSWHNFDFVAPGVMTLNGIPWTPFLSAAWREQGLLVAGRGSVIIQSQPTAANGFLFAIDFNDDDESGADFYEVVLTYRAQ